MQLFQHLKWFFRQHRWTYALALSMLFAVAMLNMAVPWFIGHAIDKLLETRDFSQAEYYLFALVGVSILVYLLRYGWRRVLMLWLGYGIVSEVVMAGGGGGGG
ncbi:hypothetical protein K6U47_11555, partial [Vibrio furnissii]|nr:hypothetical protein [Vibrio furnissii]